MGILPSVDFEEKSIQVEPNDLLVMYTDGVIESQNGHGEFYGYDRLKNIISQNTNYQVRDLVNEVFLNLEMFSKSVEQSDDITLQIMKVK